MHILLVEDHATLREALRVVLLEGCERITAVDVAATGEEALAKLARHPKYDLLLTDVTLPDLAAPELVAEACRRWPHIPVVGFTIGPTDSVIRSMLAAGALAVLDKRESLEDLCAEVTRHLDGRRN